MIGNNQLKRRWEEEVAVRSLILPAGTEENQGNTQDGCVLADILNGHLPNTSQKNFTLP
jgi:hypothetical protein